VNELRAATERRRTFAIISHPDAGKTTVTEKLLLYSGMIRPPGWSAGERRHARDVRLMGMEQERDSITASAVQFAYNTP
jgi:peptide chain release factor 3